MIDAASGDYSGLLSHDLDGETRVGIFDVGADEVLGTGLTRHTAASTGPAWLGADRVLPTSTKTWAGYPVDADNWADTGDFLGWIFVGHADPAGVIYILDLDTWAYMTETQVMANPKGAWGYFYR